MFVDLKFMEKEFFDPVSSKESNWESLLESKQRTKIKFKPSNSIDIKTYILPKHIVK